MGRKRRPLPTSLPSKLRQIRLRLGMSEEQMVGALPADTVKLCSRDITSFERGKNEPPLVVLLGYARAAFVPLEVLVDDALGLPEIERIDAPEGQCPYCRATVNQVKDGRNSTGSQRYVCRRCERRYTPLPRTNGYPLEVRLRAIALSQGGMKPGEVAREIGVNPQTVINWINAYRARCGTDMRNIEGTIDA